jgi:hypothetical protein
MDKTSTVIYSINNLSSKIQHDIIPANDLDEKQEYYDVYQLLHESELFDVNQSVVDNLVKFARQILPEKK